MEEIGSCAASCDSVRYPMKQTKSQSPDKNEGRILKKIPKTSIKIFNNSLHISSKNSKQRSNLFQTQRFLVIRQEPDNQPAVFLQCLFIIR